MVRRSAADNIEVPVVQDFAHVPNLFRANLCLLLNRVGDSGGLTGIGIAGVDNLYPFVLEIFEDMVGSASAAAENHHAQFFVRADPVLLCPRFHRFRRRTESRKRRGGKKRIA